MVPDRLANSPVPDPGTTWPAVRGRAPAHDRAAHIAVRTVSSFLSTSPDIAEVIFCCFSEEPAEAHRTALGGTG